MFEFSRKNSKEHKWRITLKMLGPEGVLVSTNDLQFLERSVKLNVHQTKFLQSLLAHLEQKNIVNYETLIESVCSRNMDHQWILEPTNLRKDKSIPNAQKTIERTLHSISENIELDELITNFSC